MRERCEYLAGTLDDRRRDEMRMCGAETEYAAAVVTEDLLEGRHHRLLTVSISLQESTLQFDGSEALHAPSGLEVVALGDVVSVHVRGGESLSQEVADCALASARGADQNDFGPATPPTNSRPVTLGTQERCLFVVAGQRDSELTRDVSPLRCLRVPCQRIADQTNSRRVRASTSTAAMPRIGLIVADSARELMRQQARLRECAGLSLEPPCRSTHRL